MTVDAGHVQVVVAVSPRLLSDAVRRTLDLDGIRTAEPGVPSPTAADVAIVSSGREREVAARTVICLQGEAPVFETDDAVRVTDLAELRSALAAALPAPR